MGYFDWKEIRDNLTPLLQRFGISIFPEFYEVHIWNPPAYLQIFDETTRYIIPIPLAPLTQIDHPANNPDLYRFGIYSGVIGMLSQKRDKVAVSQELDFFIRNNLKSTCCPHLAFAIIKNIYSYEVFRILEWQYRNSATEISLRINNQIKSGFGNLLEAFNPANSLPLINLVEGLVTELQPIVWSNQREINVDEDERFTQPIY